MARKYNVEGTKDFLVWSIVLLGLGLWCVRDGWFPPPSVLKKHPREIPAPAAVAGTVSEILAAPGAEVRDRQALVRLNALDARRAQETTAAQLTAATNALEETSRELERVAADPAAPPDRIATLRVAAQRQRATVETARKAAAAAAAEMDLREVKAPTNGTVRAVLVARYAAVAPGQAVATIAPRDHFYPFNKSLAILSLLGSAVCAIVHRVVR